MQTHKHTLLLLFCGAQGSVSDFQLAKVDEGGYFLSSNVLWETVAAMEHRRCGKAEEKCKISLFELKEHIVTISKLLVPDCCHSEKESCKIFFPFI